MDSEQSAVLMVSCHHGQETLTVYGVLLSILNKTQVEEKGGWTQNLVKYATTVFFT